MRTTSAPWSASIIVVIGPAVPHDRSSTSSPSNTPMSGPLERRVAATLLPRRARPRILTRMCGIAGFAGTDRALLDRMLASIVHRGPDGEGVDVGPHFSIGMRRLAIVDIGGGDQPLFSADGNLALVFNGEIYN